ncbi:hypothetical protein MHYP_G00020100 [Metynnis hypsauchen]
MYRGWTLRDYRYYKLYFWNPSSTGGKRRQGRQRQRWIDTCSRDLSSIGLTLQHCEKSGRVEVHTVSTDVTDDIACATPSRHGNTPCIIKNTFLKAAAAFRSSAMLLEISHRRNEHESEHPPDSTLGPVRSDSGPAERNKPPLILIYTDTPRSLNTLRLVYAVTTDISAQARKFHQSGQWKPMHEEQQRADVHYSRMGRKTPSHSIIYPR